MNKNIERNHGIDLLRLIATFMIVTLHIMGNGSVLSTVSHLTIQGELLWSIEILCFCAVNCYALISGYVGINAKHKYSNLISLCIQVVFYAVLITFAEIVIACIFNYDISLKTILIHLFPSVKHYWYFSAYFCLYFLMPILNYIVNIVPRHILKTTSAFIFVVFCCFTQFHEDVSGLLQGYSVFWLSIMYVTGGYIAKYNVLKTLSVKKSMLGYFICTAITIASKILLGYFTQKFLGHSVGIGILITYTSPTMVLGAIFLLHAFSNLKLGTKTQRTIAFLAPTSFGIYIIHCHPYILNKMAGAYAWIGEQPLLLSVVWLLTVSLSVFIICMLIDLARIRIFSFFNVKKASIFIEKYIGNCAIRICKYLGE